MKEHFSPWFKTFFIAMICFYVAMWGFSIYLSGVQKAEHIEPLLPVMSQDSGEYAALAQSILNGHDFVQEGRTDTFRVPGYPLFVALFYAIGGYFLVTFVQVILVFLSVLLIRKIGIIFSSKKVGEIAGAGFFLSPALLSVTLIVLTDVLFLFLFLLGFYLTLRLPKPTDQGKKFFLKLFLVSIIFACAIYVRPMGVFALPIFIAPFFALLYSADWSFKSILKSISLMILVIIVFISPWIIRNYRLTGVADFSSFKAINLAHYAVPLFLAHKNGTTPDEERLKLEKEIGIPREEWTDLRYSPKISSVAEKIILAQPISYGIYHLSTSMPFLFSSTFELALNTYKSALHLPLPTGIGVIHDLVSGNFKAFLRGISAVWWKMFERLIWVLVYVVAICGFWKNRKNKLAWVFLFIPAYLMALSGPVANARYAVQAMPFIFILFSAGFVAIVEKYKKKYV